jgi:hypothetical protein
MYKILLVKNLPFKQDGYYSFLNSNCKNNFKIFFFSKKLKKQKKKKFITHNITVKKLTPIQIELNFLKKFFFLIKMSKENSFNFNNFDLNYKLFCNIKFFSDDLNSYIFGLEILLFSKHDELRLFSSRLLVNSIQKHGIFNILTFLQIKINHKNKNIRMITSTTLCIFKKYKTFNILSPFLRSLFIFKKKMRIRNTICKLIQNLIKINKKLSYYERDEFIFLAEKCLRNYKNIIKTDGIKIFSILFEKNKSDSFYLPCLILPIFNGLRNHKGTVFLIYLKAARNFLKNYFLKIPIVLVIQLIDIILKFNEKSNKFNLCTIKILCLCFKKKYFEKNYIKNLTFFFFTSALEFVVSFSDETKTRVHLNALISLSKKNIVKKIFFFVLSMFFNRNFYFFNNILRLTRGLLLKYKRKKKLSFTLLSAIFIQVLSSIDILFFKINMNTPITLKLSHRILETIIINFEIFSNYFLIQLSKTLKWELKASNSIFRKQAAKTLKIISNKLNINIKNFFIYEFSVILFENLNELEPYTLSENILAINSLLKNLEFNEYIPTPDILILKYSSILKNRKKIVLKNLTKCIWQILNKDFIFLPKNQLLNISIILIKVSKNFDLTTKKYSICSVYKIAKIIGPIEMITTIFKEYNQNNKNYYFSQTSLFALFFEMFGCQVIPQIFSYFFNKIKLEAETIAIKILMYITWYLPREKIKYFSNLIFTFLEKNYEQNRKNKSNNIYVLIGLFVKKLKNNVSYLNLNKLLLNIWPDIFKSNKTVFKFIFFAIQKLSYSIESIYFKLFLSQGMFHPNFQIRKIYWYIYFSININLNNLFMICSNKRIKTI